LNVTSRNLGMPEKIRAPRRPEQELWSVTSSPASRMALACAFATIYLVWGSTYLGIRVAVETLPPFLLAGSRFLLAGGVLALLLRMRGAAPTGLWNRDTLAVGICLVASNAIVSWVEQRVASNLTALMVGMAPFFMVLFNWLVPGGSKPNRAIAAGLAFGAVGIVVLFGPGAFPAGTRPPTVCLFALFAASAIWCLGSVYSKRTGHKSAPLWTATAQMLTGGALTFAFGLAIGEAGAFHPSEVTPASWAAFAYLAIIGSMVAFPTYIWLLKHSTPVAVSTYAYVNPIIALLLGWLVLGETLPARAWFAVPVLLGGVILVTYAGAPKPAPARQDPLAQAPLDSPSAT
jgi:drug/metabolite transporter (DMT)-like permease